MEMSQDSLIAKVCMGGLGFVREYDRRSSPASFPTHPICIVAGVAEYFSTWLQFVDSSAEILTRVGGVGRGGCSR